MGFSKQGFFAAVLLISATSMAAPEMEVMAPSTYSTHYVDARTAQCETKLPVMNKKGEEIIQLCKRDLRACRFEGACVVETEGGKIGLSYHSFDEIADQVYFSKVSTEICPFGYGYVSGKVYKQLKTRDLCLDPFFSVAADLTAYKVGDVLFVPTLQGSTLPSGEIHDGFVIVRDSSTFHEGAGNYRITFFTGFLDAENEDNVFARRGLTDIDFPVNFRLATEEEAKQVRLKRNFPSLPAHLMKQGK